MSEKKLKVIILTHGGANRLLELLAELRTIEIVGVFIETATEPQRSFKQKITRSIRYDGYLKTAGKFSAKLFGEKTGGAEDLKTVSESQNELQNCAEHLKIPVYKVENYHSEPAIDLLTKTDADLGILYGTNIIKESVFAIPRLGSINIHQGLAPIYRGGPTVFWELFNGEKEIGITVHFVAAKVDTGDIILQETLPLRYDFERYGLNYESFLADFRQELREPSARLIAEAVRLIAEGKEQRTKQDTTIGKRYRLPTKTEKDALLSVLKSGGAAKVNREKTLLKTFYNLGAFAPFHLTTRGRILILTYHRFSRDANPSKVSAAEFASHLAYLKKHNHVLSLSKVAEHLETGKPLPPGATVITIDDGYADAYEIAFPLLKKFDFPATLFAVTDFLDEKLWLWTDLMRYVLSETKEDFLNVEFEENTKIEIKLTGEPQRLSAASRVNSYLKKLPNEQKETKIREIAETLNVKIPALPTFEFAPVSWAQAREMDASVLRVESHTVTHPILTNVNQTQLDYELRTSKTRLENELNRTVETFCYPNGSLNETVWQSVKNSGYKAAVTTNYGFNGAGENPFTLNRIDAQSAIENFAQSVSGFEALKQRN